MNLGFANSLSYAIRTPHRYEYFLKGAQLPSVQKTGGKLDFGGLKDPQTWVALITFLYLDFMDGTSVMVSWHRAFALGCL